jgi:hypothetical protein
VKARYSSSEIGGGSGRIVYRRWIRVGVRHRIGFDGCWFVDIRWIKELDRVGRSGLSWTIPNGLVHVSEPSGLTSTCQSLSVFKLWCAVTRTAVAQSHRHTTQHTTQREQAGHQSGANGQLASGVRNERRKPLVVSVLLGYLAFEGRAVRRVPQARTRPGMTTSARRRGPTDTRRSSTR